MQLRDLMFPLLQFIFDYIINFILAIEWYLVYVVFLHIVVLILLVIVITMAVGVAKIEELEKDLDEKIQIMEEQITTINDFGIIGLTIVLFVELFARPLTRIFPAIRG